ncbi:MAG: hypothetical protein GX341_05410 [Firmicutes bacterium]|jgi:hypothetical protein|nr:hypothetical protein [Bacillota bacterium]
MLQLRITHYFGRIGINHVPSQLEISCPMADMKIQQELGQLEIKREPPAVKLDLKEAFGDLGMKRPDLLAEAAKWEAVQRFHRGLDRVVAEGDRLSRIELGGHPLIDIVRENVNQQRELNITAAPKARPRVEVVGGGFSYQYHPGGVHIDVEPQSPEIRYYPGKVEIYLLQEPGVDMEVVGVNIDGWA